MTIFTGIVFAVWVWAMVVGVWSAEAARMFARRMKKAAGRDVGAYGPRVAVILPVKGINEETAANVRALLTQNYPVYRVIFAVESAEDAAWGWLQERIAEVGAERAAVVVAGLTKERGQKVHNQLAAVDRTVEADEVLVFVDADAQVHGQWLRALVGPLQFAEVGATTGYRFYLPRGRHVASAMVSVINAGVAALLGPQHRNFAWGGSMGIRRRDFFGMGVYAAWQEALSDDYVMSHFVKYRAQYKIEFVPRCVVGSWADFDWGSFFRFACRQYRITRICAVWVWWAAVGGAVVYLGVLATTLGYWLTSWAQGRPDHGMGVMGAALYITTVVRGYWLLSGGQRSVPAQAAVLRRIGWWYTWGYPAVVAVNLAALLGAAWGRRIEWRGVHYTMQSRTETVVEIRGADREGT